MSNAERTRIAERLRQARASAGLSQGQIAKLLGMHRPTITEIEAGRRRVSAEELGALADAYGVTVQWLATDQDDSSLPQDDRILLAAREIAKMKGGDIDRLISVLKMLRGSESRE